MRNFLLLSYSTISLPFMPAALWIETEQ